MQHIACKTLRSTTDSHLPYKQTRATAISATVATLELASDFQTAGSSHHLSFRICHSQLPPRLAARMFHPIAEVLVPQTVFVYPLKTPRSSIRLLSVRLKDGLRNGV